MDFVFIDVSKIRRGGQVYMERLASSLKKEGRICELAMRSGQENMGLVEVVIYVLRCIVRSRCWLVGTAPSFLPVFLVARRSILLIQSPVDEWSWKARTLLKLARKKKGRLVICVSDYVKKQVDSRGHKSSLVVYAQMAAERNCQISSPIAFKNRRQVALAMMNPREFNKGYLCSVVLIESLCREVELVVDVYSESVDELVEIKDCCHLELHGYAEDPFEDFALRRKGMKRVYLGMSHFEGLHMAVVEAARKGIPSILSDIPAHRELEKLVGEKIMIGGTQQEYAELMRMIVESDDYYERMVEIYRSMGEEFLMKGRSGMSQLMKVVNELEAEEGV